MSRTEELEKIIFETLRRHGYHANWRCVREIVEKVEAQENAARLDSWGFPLNDSWGELDYTPHNSNSWI